MSKLHLRQRHVSEVPFKNNYLLFLLLFLLFESLYSFVGSHQLGEVGHVLVCLLQQVGQTLVFLLVNEFTISFFIFSLGVCSQRC